MSLCKSHSRTIQTDLYFISDLVSIACSDREINVRMYSRYLPNQAGEAKANECYVLADCQSIHGMSTYLTKGSLRKFMQINGLVKRSEIIKNSDLARITAI
jgi:hypothetical protein